MNWREMTPRERTKDAAKAIALTLATGIGMAWMLVEVLAK